MQKDMRMLGVDDSSFNLLSRCHICPILGLVVGIQTWGVLGSLCFSAETSKGAKDGSNGEHHQGASDPKKRELR